MMHSLVIIIGCLLTWLLPQTEAGGLGDNLEDQQVQYDILMIISLPFGELAEADLVTLDTLESWGYTVNMVDDNEYVFEDHSNYKLVYFSESMGSELSVHYRSSGFPIPAFSHEPYIVDRLGWGRVNQEARDQQAVIEEMKIIASNHPVTDGIWDSGQILKVTENTDPGTHDVFQFEFDLDDHEVDSRVRYNALGRMNLNVSPWKGFPSWAVIYGGKGQIPEDINIIIHAFHLGSSLKGTPVYWLQMRRSIQYLLGEL